MVGDDAMTSTDARSQPHSRGRLLAVAAALVVALVVVYWPVRHADYLTLDDTAYVTENPYVRAGFTAPGVRHALFGSRAGLWMPLAFLSHMVDVELFGLDPTGPHLVNVGLHAANAVLLLLLLVRATGAFGASAAVAALFALHPLRVESVAWIAERKDVLSVCFGLLTLHAWVSWVRGRGRARYGAVLVLTLLALLSKPMLVTLPVLMLLLDVWPLRRLAADASPRATPWSLLLEKVPLLLLAAGTAAMTLATAHGEAAMETLAGRPVSVRAAHAAVSYVWYVAKTVWPSDLAIFYPYPTWAPGQIAGAAALLVLGAALAFATRRRAPWIAVGLAWFVLALFPVIGFLQAGSQGMADRFTYLPSIGLLVAAVWSVDACVRSPRARTALGGGAIVVAGALALLSARVVDRWRDPLALFGHTLAVTRDNWMIETEVGNVWLRRGDAERAYARFEEAYRVQPRYPAAAFGLGLAATSLGRPDEAELHYRAAIAADAGYARAHNNLGILLYERDAVDEALHHLLEAARLNPESPEFAANVRAALARVGVADAAAYLQRLARLSDDVAADRARTGGAAYGAALMGPLIGQRVEAVRSCFGANGGGRPAPFAIYVAVAADGALEEVAALPPTRVARCFGDELRATRAPAPPFSPFHALMAM
jgi:hypothetical protein